MAYDSQNEAEEAASLLALARQTHEAHVAAAKVKADGIISRAQEEADVILTNAREEHTWLEEKIAKHRDFEARYRGAISTYLQDLLDEINQDDEFIAPASLTPVVETVEEDSAFAVDEDPVSVEELDSFNEPEPVVEETTVEEATHEAPVVEESVFEEPHDEFTYQEAPVEVAAQDEFTYDAPALEELDEPAPTFAEGDAPVPSFELAPLEDSDDHYGDDLPAVPENIDAFGSSSDDIEALNNELKDHHPEDQEEIENFDSLLSGEPKSAIDSVGTPTEDSSDDEGDKGVRSFFGFKKN